MKYIKLITLFSLFIHILCGCSYYESKVPITNPEESFIDKTILGKWSVINEKDGEQEQGYIEILPFNNQEYIVSIYEYMDSTKLISSVEHLRMFNSTVKKGEYFNIQPIKKDTCGSFFIFKSNRISQNKMKIYYLSKDMFSQYFENPKIFREYIEKFPKEFDSSFQPEGVLIRIEK